jgi:hypothetical protein
MPRPRSGRQATRARAVYTHKGANIRMRAQRGIRLMELRVYAGRYACPLNADKGKHAFVVYMRVSTTRVAYIRPRGAYIGVRLRA